jgi:hypothetical protein
MGLPKRLRSVASAGSVRDQDFTELVEVHGSRLRVSDDPGPPSVKGLARPRYDTAGRLTMITDVPSRIERQLEHRPVSRHCVCFETNLTAGHWP